MNEALNPRNFNRTYPQLEHYLLFCIFVAGKSSKTQSDKLEIFLNLLDNPELPISALSKMTHEEIRSKLEAAKAGQYTNLSKCLYELSRANFDLRTVSCEELETIHKIGFKTSRFFVVYTRPNSNYGILDTHILKWLSESYPDVPKSTPSSLKLYQKWENVFLSVCKEKGLNADELDFELWVSRQKSWKIEV